MFSRLLKRPILPLLGCIQTNMHTNTHKSQQRVRGLTCIPGGLECTLSHADMDSAQEHRNPASLHTAPLWTHPHTCHPNMSKCTNVCVGFPSSHSKKSSVSFGKDPCKHRESQKNFTTLESVHLQSLLTWNILQP